mgnify:CR=1 FL=1
MLSFIPAMQAALHEPETIGLNEHLTNVQFERTPWLSESNGGRWGRYGWYLGSKEHGSLRIRLPFSQAGVLKLRFWAHSAGALVINVTDETKTHEIPSAQLDSRIIRVAVNGPSEIVVTASSELLEEQLVLDRFAVAWSEVGNQLPSLMPLVFGIVLCIGGWLVIARRYSTYSWQQWAGGIAILVATVAGVGERWEALDMARGFPVDPDVVSYMAYARSFDWFSQNHGFYSGTFGEREPLYVAGLDVWFRLWGDTFPAIRLLTVVASILLVSASGLFIWQISESAILGGLAACIVAVNPVWVEESVRGLRLEVLSLLLICSISLWINARGWVGAVVLGCTIGALGLVQTPILTIMLGACWCGWGVASWIGRRQSTNFTFQHWRWPHLVLVSIVAIALYAPHLYGLYIVYGDPAQPSKGYARWNANFEFPERIGTPGFPAAEDFAKNPYAGPPLTYREYLFGLHSIPTLIKGQIKGWLESTAYMSTSLAPQVKDLIFLYQASGTKAVMAHVTLAAIVVFIISLGLTAIGWFDLWRYPQYCWVPFLSLWGTWYVAYLYSVRLVEPFRHTGHVYPLLLFCLLWGGFQVYQRLRVLFIDGGGIPLAALVANPVNRKSARALQSGNPRPE